MDIITYDGKKLHFILEDLGRPKILSLVKVMGNNWHYGGQPTTVSRVKQKGRCELVVQDEYV